MRDYLLDCRELVGEQLLALPTKELLLSQLAERISAIANMLLVDLSTDHLLLSTLAFAGAFEMLLTLLLGPVAANLEWVERISFGSLSLIVTMEIG